jgi:hypothetical protein
MILRAVATPEHNILARDIEDGFGAWWQRGNVLDLAFSLFHSFDS